MTVRSERPHTADRGPPYTSQRHIGCGSSLFSPLPLPLPFLFPPRQLDGERAPARVSGIKAGGSTQLFRVRVISWGGGECDSRSRRTQEREGRGRGGPVPTRPPAHPGYREQKDAFQDAQLGRHREGRRWRVFVCQRELPPTLPWDIDWSDAMVYVRYLCVLQKVLTVVIF